MSIEFVSSACCLPELSRAELFKTVKSCGYAHTELFAMWTSSKFSTSDTPETTRIDGVGVSAVHLPGDVETAKGIIDRAAACGIPQVIVHGAGAPADAAVWLKPLVIHARKAGIGIVLTNHKGQSIETPDDVRTALAACGDDRPGVLFEAGQYWAAGIDAIAEFEGFEKETRLIHIKDLDANGKSVPFGAGKCPLADFLGKVGQSSYQGRIVLEVETKAPLSELASILADALVKSREWLANVSVK